MHQHISCGAPIFFYWRDEVGEHSEQLGFFDGGDFGEQLGATRSTRSTRSTPTIVLTP